MRWNLVLIDLGRVHGVAAHERLGGKEDMADAIAVLATANVVRARVREALATVGGR